MLSVSRVGMLTALLSLTAAASLLRPVAALPYPLELFRHYPLHYGLLLALGTALLLAMREKKRAALFGLFAAWNIGVVTSDLWGWEAPAANEPKLKVVLANVHTENRMFEETEDFLLAEDPEILVLLEVSHLWWARLDRLRERYPHGKHVLRGDNFGIAVMSKTPFSELELLKHPDSFLPSYMGKITLDGVPLTLIATHPLPPTSQEHTARRNSQLAHVASAAREARTSGEVLLMGDLNTTPWNPVFGGLLRVAGLRDTRKGFGLQATWPADLPFLLLPLDHILVSPGLGVLERRTGDWNGSDHRPVIATLSLRG
jgi:endonuclease/exonuclease/phosphatase (EEP) superfamily protein YafD